MLPETTTPGQSTTKESPVTTTYFLMLFFVFWVLWDLRYMLTLLIIKLRYGSVYDRGTHLTGIQWFEITAFAAAGTLFFHNVW